MFNIALPKKNSPSSPFIWLSFRGGYVLYTESRYRLIPINDPKARALRRCHAIEVLVGRCSTVSSWMRFDAVQSILTLHIQSYLPRWTVFWVWFLGSKYRTQTPPPYTSTRRTFLSTKKISSIFGLCGFSAWQDPMSLGGTWSFLCSVELGRSWGFACLLVSEVVTKPMATGGKEGSDGGFMVFFFWWFGYGRVDSRDLLKSGSYSGRMSKFDGTFLW